MDIAFMKVFVVEKYFQNYWKINQQVIQNMYKELYTCHLRQLATKNFLDWCHKQMTLTRQEERLIEQIEKADLAEQSKFGGH